LFETPPDIFLQELFKGIDTWSMHAILRKTIAFEARLYNTTAPQCLAWNKI
jgi:hypothetical protein